MGLDRDLALRGSAKTETQGQIQDGEMLEWSDTRSVGEEG